MLGIGKNNPFQPFNQFFFACKRIFVENTFDEFLVEMGNSFLFYLGNGFKALFFNFLGIGNTLRIA